MNSEQAKYLIKNTFENSFDELRFRKFIKNLLKEFDDKKTFQYKGQYIKESFKPYISSLQRIGKYIDKEENTIDILIVKLKRSSSVENARATQRNFIRWYLNGSRGGELKDAALVAFISPDNEDWRFSLVKMDYKIKYTKDGKTRIEEDITPARRWSFLVGKNEKSHTAQSRFLSLLKNDKYKPTLEDLEEAFSIENVTEEFFNNYRDLLIRTVDELDNILNNEEQIKNDFKLKNINTVDFAKKLLGQIVFLYFLQKKGWFGVKRDSKWGSGPKDFIRKLFNEEYGEYKNFFNDVLEPLFYEALARERDDNFYSRFNCKIPFLNGGLFDPIGGYDWIHSDIMLPNELFSNTNRTSQGDIGDGILDVFDRFNFTVKEDEPLEKEVAIDPELLGKLYEKFNAIRPDNFYEYKKALTSDKKDLEKKFNKKFGVYYTPREIVHYMCQQSLIYYLENSTNISSTDLEKLIKFGEQLTENETIAIIKEQLIKEGKQKSSDYKSKLPESIRKNAKFIDDKLSNIKICDPAVGSGAFPVGMMHEIVKIRKVLSIYINNKDIGNEEKNICNFKRECIENSLYGVDIDHGATEVTKLRLWLSLIVDEENINQIKPLPNLDYKIVRGNSLLGIKENLFNNDLFNQLEKLKSLYFKETNPIKKQSYKNQIEKLISTLTKEHEIFDFKVYFPEVFYKKDGFDIVIGNPPYSGKIKTDEKKYIVKNYKYYDRRKNSASLFIELGKNLSKNKTGIISYIVPKSLTFSEGWNPTRSFLLDLISLKILLDVSRAFNNVLLEQVIIIAINTSINKEKTYLSKEWWSKELATIGLVPYSLAKKINLLPIYLDSQKIDLLKKISENSVLLSNISEIYRGIPLQSLLKKQGKIDIIRGKDIEKYKIHKNLLKIEKIPTKFEKRATNLMKKKIVSQNIIAHVFNPYDQLKIMSTIDYSCKINVDTVINIFIDENKFLYEYVLAILNSRLSNWFFYWFVYNRAIRTMHFDKFYIGKLPLKVCSAKEQNIFKQTVKQIIDKKERKSEDTLEEEFKIDLMVYKLYKLSYEEVKIVDPEIKKKISKDKYENFSII